MYSSWKICYKRPKQHMLIKKMMFIAPTQFSDHVCPRPIKIL